MNLQSLKNGIAAAAVGVSILGAGCAKKAPAIEKAVTQTAQTVKMKGGNLAKDTIDFAKAKAYTDSLKHVNKDLTRTKELVETISNVGKNLKPANVQTDSAFIKAKAYTDTLGKEIKDNERIAALIETLTNLVQNIKIKK